MSQPTTQVMRRKPDHTISDNDYITVRQCAKLAAGIAKQMIEDAIEEHDRLQAAQSEAAREARWHRRALAWLRRPRGA